MQVHVDRRSELVRRAGALLLVCALSAACAQDQTNNGGGGSGGSTGTGSGGSPTGSGGAGAIGATGGASGTGGATGSGGATLGAGGSATGGGSGGVAGGSSGGTAGAGTGGVAGAPGTAGTKGAAGGGGGGTAFSGCAGKTYKLCEDFESGTVGGLPTGWTVYQGYGKGAATDVGLASDEAHAGAMSLKSDSAATGQRRVQRSLAALGPTASKHWGRIFYKVQAPAPLPSGSNVLHVTFVGLYGANQENRVVDIVENSKGAHQWLYNNPDDKGGLGSDYSWMFDGAWHCAEWYEDVSTKSFRFFADGTPVTKIGFVNKTDSEMVDPASIILGATFYQTPPSAWIMWFDDLAIDDNQIGCQ